MARHSSRQCGNGRCKEDSGISASRITKQALLPRWRKPSRARNSISFRSTIRSWNAKPRKKFYRWRRTGASPVIVNRPFSAGDLFHRVRGKPLPDFAAEFNCTSWAQFLLKWIVAHPAVTCAIPATNNVQHLEDNMRGGVGRLPDAKLR